MLTKRFPGDSSAPHLHSMKNHQQIVLNAQECDKPNESTKYKRLPTQKCRMNSVLTFWSWRSKSEVRTLVL